MTRWLWLCKVAGCAFFSRCCSALLGARCDTTISLLFHQAKTFTASPRLCVSDRRVFDMQPLGLKYVPL